MKNFNLFFGVLFLLAIFTMQSAEAQLNYTRTPFTGTYTAISTGGGATTSTASGDAVVQTAVPIGFSFTYNGTAYTTLTVATDGWASFTATTATGTNTAMYTTAAPNATLAPWWDDMTAPVGSILYQTQGTAPNRTFIVQWSPLSFYTGTTRTINFQIVLYETSNVIEFKYGGYSGGNAYTSESANIGIENQTGGNGNYIDAITGSKNTGNAMMTTNKFPTRFYRFTPGAPTAISVGSYSVGVGQTYPNLSEAFADVNHRGISGPITLNLTDLTYDSTTANGNNIFPVLLGPVAGASATNTITISKTGMPATLKFNGTGAGSTVSQNGTSAFGTTSEPLIGLVGADYVTIDNLIIDGNNSSYGSYYLDEGIGIMNTSVSDGAQNNTIKNTKVTLNRTNTSSKGIYQLYYGSPTSAAGANSYNKFYDLTIENAYNGIYLLGLAAYPDLNTEIGSAGSGKTTIGSTTANDIGNSGVLTYGIRVAQQSGIKIFNCEVRNVSGGPTSTAAVYGILLDGLKGTSAIYNNNIHDIKCNNTSNGSYINGIVADAASGVVINIYNNFVSAISSASTLAASTVYVRGIAGFVAAGTGTVNVYYNSVRLESSAYVSSTALYTQSGTMNAVDNVLSNFSTAGATSKRYCFYVSSGTLSKSNYNDFYINTSGTGNNVGYYSAADRNTLANWQTITTKDANSVNVDPVFSSATNLHSASSGLNAAGVTVSVANGDALDITTDIDVETRAGTPDIGADEFVLLDLTSKGEAPTTQITSTTVSSTVTTSGAAVDVFAFKITDMASGDGQPTKVTNLRITNANPTNGASWTANIAGVTLRESSLGTITIGTPTITASYIDIPITMGNLNIADGTSGNMTLAVYLKTTGIEDGKKLQFTVPQTGHSWGADISGSVFATDFGAAFTSNEHTIDVSATKLIISNITSLLVKNTNFGLTVTAKDANDNPDIDNTTSVTVARNVGTGTLSSVTGLTQSLVAGVYSWTDLQYSKSEVIRLQADGGLLTQAVTGDLTVYGAVSYVPTPITIGTGTSTQYYPFDVYYGYSRNAALYTSAQIGYYGAISKLAWYVSATSATSCPIKIYLKTQTGSTVTADTWANMITGATLVYDGTRTFSAAGWNEQAITSFDYTSGNLLVLTEGNYGGGGATSYPSFRYTTTISQNANQRADNTPPITNLTVGSLLPNIQITLPVPTPVMDHIFTSSTTTQTVTTPVGIGATNRQIIGVQIVTGGGTNNPISVSQIDFSTSGSTNASVDIDKARVFYTGTSSVFTTATQLGSDVTSPNGSFSVSGLSQTLPIGTSYFWLVYDIKSTATASNVVDATCDLITTSDGTKTPTVTAPAGNRTILAPLNSALNGDYTVGTSAFFKLLGKNLTPVKQTRTVTKEVTEYIKEKISDSEKSAKNEKNINYESKNKINNESNIDIAETEYTGVNEDDANYRIVPVKKTITVEELYVVYMDGDKPYSGPRMLEPTPDEARKFGIKADRGVYLTITDAVNDLSGRGVDGYVNFVLIDNLYDESTGEIYPLNITAPLGTSATNIVTFKPDPNAKPVISGTTATPIFNLEGASYIVFEGSIDGSSSIDVTIQNNNTTAPVFQFINGSRNNTIKNFDIRSANATTTSGAIIIGSTTALGNSNNTFHNNKIHDISGTGAPYNGIYATSSATIPNTNNTITNNEIYNFTSIGVYVNTGNGNNWTINNNQIYNALTSSVYQTGIYFSPGATSKSSTISGNTIGGSAINAGGTPWTTNGAFTLNGIFVYADSVDASTVSNNIVRNISLTNTGAAPFNGIVVYGGLVNVIGNTIGHPTTANSIVNVGSGTTNGISISQFYNNMTTITTRQIVKDNEIANISATGTGSTVYLRGISHLSFSYLDITRNKIHHLSTTSSSVSSAFNGFALTGILAWQQTYHGETCDSNTIHTLTAGNTGALATKATGIASNNFDGTISRNIIYNIVNNSTGTTLTAPPIAAGIIQGYCGNGVIKNNLISLGDGLTNDVQFDGIIQISGWTGGVSTWYIYYNTINISGAPTAGTHKSYAFVVGNNSGTLIYPSPVLRNNILDNQRSGGTGKYYSVGYQVVASTYGGWTATASNYNILNSSSSATVGDWAGVDKTFDAWKTSSAGDANSWSGQTVTYTNAAIGDLHINMGTTPTILESNGTEISGLTVDFDNQVRPGPPGSVNGGGTIPDIGADEFDGVMLDLNPPTITYIPLLNTASTGNRTLNSTITDGIGTGVNFTIGTAPRIYYKRSTDANDFVGNTSADNGWKYVETLTGSSPCDLNIDNSLIYNIEIQPIVVGDVIQYFVIAQDLASVPNVRINSGTPATAPTSVNLISANFPMGGTINSYQITESPLSGDYNIGLAEFNKVSGRNIYFVTKTVEETISVPVYEENSEIKDKEQSGINNTINDKNIIGYEKKVVEKQISVPMENGKEYKGELYYESRNGKGQKAGTWPTITLALAQLNLRGVSSSVRFLLTDAQYDNVTLGETFPLTINSIPGVSATNTFTLLPASGVSTVITGASASGPILKLFSTNYAIIDGSNNGTTSRNMSITNTSATTPYVVWIGSNGTTPSTNDTLKNCNITNGVNTSTAIAISNGTTIASPGYFNNITIQNNSIKKAYTGISCNAVVATSNGSGLSLLNNLMNSTGTDAISYVGISVQGVDGVSISGNEIGNFDKAGAQDDIGLILSTGTKNATIEKNKIYTIGYSGTSGYGAKGIIVSTAVTSANIMIKNNVIYDITGDGDDYVTNGSAYNPVGISLSSIQTGIEVYYNSINLFGNTLNYTANSISMGIFLGTGTTANIRNNVIVNNLGRLSATGYGACGIYAQTDNTQFINIDFNDYYINPTGTVVKAIGKLSTTTTATTIAEWRTATTKDVSSISADPLFTSNTNLQPNVGSPVLNTGTPISGITKDILGVDRVNNTSMGAYEFGTDMTAPAITYTVLGNTTSTSNVTLTPVTISDASGVDVSGNKPRIYYKKSWNANAFVGNTSTDNGWKWTEFTPSTAYDFEIDYNKLYSTGAVTGGDIIQYFVVAQDLFGTPNVGASPSTGFTGTSVSNITSAPTTPNSYSINSASPLSGTYNIGLAAFNLASGKNLYYSKETREVERLFPVIQEQKSNNKSDKNSSDKNKSDKGITEKDNNVKIESNETITNKTEDKIVYEKRIVKEDYFVLMENGKPYEGPLFAKYSSVDANKGSNKTMNGIETSYRIGAYATISSAIGDLNFAGVSGPVTFVLSDASYNSESFPIIINAVSGGSNINTVTIKPATGISTSIQGNNASALLKLNGADFITIDGSNNNSNDRSLTFTNTSLVGSVVWIGSSGTGAGATNNIIKNCNLKMGGNASGTYGIFAGSGTTLGSAGDDNDTLTIQNNSISKAYYGIQAFASVTGVNDNLSILDNTVGSNTAADYLGHDGIYVSYANNSNINRNNVFNIITSNTTPVGITLQTSVTNTVLSKNVIDDIRYTGIGGYSGRGFYVNTGSATSNLLIDNNVITRIGGDGWTTFDNSSMVGMFFDGTTGGLNIYYNSVYMSGEFTRATATLTTAILFNTATVTNIDLRNNIFVNTMDNTGMTTDKNYAIYSTAPATSFTQINYNDYYVSGVQGILGNFATVDKTTLALWKASSLQDGNSYNGDPGFTSNFNLLPVSTNENCWNVFGKGIQIPTFSTDITGASRSTTTANGPTCFGAYEFTVNSTTNVPPTATQTGTIGASATTNYGQAGRNLLDITWGLTDNSSKNISTQDSKNNLKGKTKGEGTMSAKSYPSSVIVKYYSAINPPDRDTSYTAQFGKGYWQVTADANPTSPVTLKIYYGDQETGTIDTVANNLILSKYDPTTRVWVPFNRGTTDGESNFDGTNKTVTVSGLTELNGTIFALTSQRTPLKRLKLDLTVLIQGLYFDGGLSNYQVKDSIKIILKDSTSGWATIDSLIMPLDSLGQGYILTEKSITGRGYYMVIIHRNALETWSNLGDKNFSKITGRQIFDFTSAQDQAFGSNLIQKNLKWCLYSGDVTDGMTIGVQDGFIEYFDLDAIFNDNNNFVEGWVVTDLNGDLFTEYFDLDLVFNNNNLFVEKKLPPNFPLDQKEKVKIEIMRNKIKSEKLNLDKKKTEMQMKGINSNPVKVNKPINKITK